MDVDLVPVATLSKLVHLMIEIREGCFMLHNACPTWRSV